MKKRRYKAVFYITVDDYLEVSAKDGLRAAFQQCRNMLGISTAGSTSYKATSFESPKEITKRRPHENR